MSPASPYLAVNARISVSPRFLRSSPVYESLRTTVSLDAPGIKLFGVITRPTTISDRPACLVKLDQLPESETVFNFWLIHPFLPIVATASQDVKRLRCDFVPGETAFASITKQLIALGKHKDDRYQYSANGIIRLHGFRTQKVLVVETSGELGNRDKAKLNFDHHMKQHLAP